MEHAFLEVGLPESYVYVTFDDIKRLYNLAGADLVACSTAATWEFDVAEHVNVAFPRAWRLAFGG